jgi:hypothetical protein
MVPLEYATTGSGQDNSEPATRWFLPRLAHQRTRWKRAIAPKRRVTFVGLHGVISRDR